MAQGNRLIGQVSLANGLEVYFYDLSKEILADRWHVRLSIQIPIGLRREYLEGAGQDLGAMDAFLRTTGGQIYFEVERQLNFVDSKKVEESLELIKNEFMKTNFSYLASPGFAPKFALKRYREWLEQEKLRSRYTEHLLSPEQTEK